MVNSTDCKVVMLTQPGAIVDNASFTTAELDTLGYSHCDIYFAMGATDIGITVLKVQECAASGGSFADVTGLVFGTSTNAAGSTSSLPADDDDDTVFVFEIDLKARERYLDLVATGGDGDLGTFAVAWAVLSRPKESPTTAAGRGASQILRA